MNAAVRYLLSALAGWCTLILLYGLSFVISTNSSTRHSEFGPFNTFLMFMGTLTACYLANFCILVTLLGLARNIICLSDVKWRRFVFGGVASLILMTVGGSMSGLLDFSDWLVLAPLTFASSGVAFIWMPDP